MAEKKGPWGANDKKPTRASGAAKSARADNQAAGKQGSKQERSANNPGKGSRSAGAANEAKVTSIDKHMSKESGSKPPSNNPWGPQKGGRGNGSGDHKGADNEFDRMIRDGQAQIRRIIGGGGGGGHRNSGAGAAPPIRSILFILFIILIAIWIYLSLYFVQATDRALVLRFGEHVDSWGEGPHFAPWPIYTVETANVTEQQTERIGEGTGANGQDWSLMLTSDENIIDIEFEVVWRIKDLAAFQFNLEGQRQTIHAVAQSSIREVVARSPLIPLLSTERDNIVIEVKKLIQDNLDAYNSGIEIVRVNLTKSDAPTEVIKDFEDVQAAEQERDTQRSQAQAKANVALANARGEEAQLREDAEAYRAQVINDAQGQASRFLSVLGEFEKAPDVTRRRLYLETMQEVYGQMDKVLIGEGAGEGVVPYLPLNELNRNRGGGGPGGAAGEGEAQ